MTISNKLGHETHSRDASNKTNIQDNLLDAKGLKFVYDSVLRPSEMLEQYHKRVQGLDLNQQVTFQTLISSFATTGFQATNLSEAVRIIRSMREWRPLEKDIRENSIPADARTFIFLGYTSNLVSSGLRDVIRYLVQHKLISCICSTAGGIEEDLIKCLAPTFVAKFDLDGILLRQKGLNRIGNLIVPNENYCMFEDWIMPILDKMHQQQVENGVLWSPQTMIRYLGQNINDESSILYWAYKNDIPIFCPSLTDGSIGDMLYIHSYRKSGLVIDINQDIRYINTLAVRAKRTGIITLGGGLIKHHICNANLMRNGADYAVYINTAQEFDGSDSGAKISEAHSWGKIKAEADTIKVYADATIVFPLIAAAAFCDN